MLLPKATGSTINFLDPIVALLWHQPASLPSIHRFIHLKVRHCLHVLPKSPYMFLYNNLNFDGSIAKDFLDLDDEIHLSEAGSTPFPEQREKLKKSMLASKARSSKAVTVDKNLISSEMKTLDGPVMKQSDNFGASDLSLSGEKKTSFTFPTISSSHISSHEALATQSTSEFDKNVPLKDQIAPTPLFSFSSDNIDKVSTLAFSSPSSASEFVGLKGSAPTKSKPENSYRSVSLCQ